MIVQTLLDFLSGSLATILNGLPQLPVAVGVAMQNMRNSAHILGAGLGNLSPVVPFDVVNNCLLAFTGVLVYWAAMTSVRLIAWLINR